MRKSLPERDEATSYSVQGLVVRWSLAPPIEGLTEGWTPVKYGESFARTVAATARFFSDPRFGKHTLIAAGGFGQVHRSGVPDCVVKISKYELYESSEGLDEVDAREFTQLARKEANLG